MKHILITTIAAVLLVGCGPSQPSEKDLELIKSARIGDIEAAKKYLANGANANAKNKLGETPLHGAAFNNRTNIIRLLLDNGANINAEDNNGYTPMDMAKGEASLLLDKLGGKENKRIEIATQERVKLNTQEAQKQIKSEKSSGMDLKTIEKISSEVHQVKNIIPEMEHFVQQAGVWEVSMSNGENKNTMKEAPTFYSFVKVVDGKFKVSQFQPPYESSLRLSVTSYDEDKNYYNIWKPRKGGGINESILTIDLDKRTFRENSSKLEDDSESFRFIGTYADDKIESSGEYYRNSQLIQAIEHKMKKIGNLDLKLIIDANKYEALKKREDAPKIPIWEAVGRGDILTVRQHLASGTDANLRQGFSGWTPLTIAALNNRLNVAILLILNGADVNSVGLRSTALSESGGRFMMTKLLLANGADTEVKIGGPKNTVLHRAALRGRIKIVELLISYKANVNSLDYLGETPLDKARGKTANLLRKHGGKTGEELKAEGK